MIIELLQKKNGVLYSLMVEYTDKLNKLGEHDFIREISRTEKKSRMEELETRLMQLEK